MQEGGLFENYVARFSVILVLASGFPLGTQYSRIFFFSHIDQAFNEFSFESQTTKSFVTQLANRVFYQFMVKFLQIISI